MGEKQDRTLPEKLQGEIAGILNWAIDGCLKWRALGSLQTPDKIIAATEEYKREEDVVGRFIEDCCEMEQHGRVTSAALFNRFKEWLQEQGIRSSWTQKSLGTELTNRGLENKKSNGFKCWSGIKLLDHDTGSADGYQPEPIFFSGENEPSDWTGGSV